MRYHANRSGFAMPLALLVLTVLTLGVTTAFARAQAELRTTQDHEADTESFLYAQTGLERFAVERRTFGFTTNPPAVVESTRITLPKGFVDVVARRVRPKTGNQAAVYLLKAKSAYQTGSMSWMPRANHIVTQYAHYREGSMKVLAAWTSLSGLRKNGSSGTLSGSDACGLSPPVAAVAVPDNPGYAQSGGAPVPEGSPAVDSLGSQQAANDSVKIDWPAIKTRGALGAGITIPGGSWPSFANPNYWPTIMVHGDFSLPGDGRGLLVVTGYLTIPGSRSWNGIVLVGQNIISNGNNTILGTAISGLDMKLGLNVPTADLGSGTKTFQYNSCFVASAIANVGWLVPYRNAWVDNWASY